MLSSRILLNFVSATTVIIIVFLEELGTVSSLASGNNAYKKPKTNQKQHISSSSNQHNSELQAAALLVATLVFTAALTHYVNLISQSKRYFPVKGVTLPSLEKNGEDLHQAPSLLADHRPLGLHLAAHSGDGAVHHRLLSLPLAWAAAVQEQGQSGRKGGGDQHFSGSISSSSPSQPPPPSLLP